MVKTQTESLTEFNKEAPRSARSLYDTPSETEEIHGLLPVRSLEFGLISKMETFPSLCGTHQRHNYRGSFRSRTSYTQTSTITESLSVASEYFFATSTADPTIAVGGPPTTPVTTNSRGLSTPSCLYTTYLAAIVAVGPMYSIYKDMLKSELTHQLQQRDPLDLVYMLPKRLDASPASGALDLCHLSRTRPPMGSS